MLLDLHIGVYLNKSQHINFNKLVHRNKKKKKIKTLV